MWFIASRASCRDAPRRARASLLLCDAPQVIFHAALCEVASPDGVVGREWCYVEVKLPGQPIVAHIRGRVRVGHGNGHVRLREFMVAYVRVCVWGCVRPWESGSAFECFCSRVRVVWVCMFVRVGAMAQAQTCEDGVGGQGSTDWVRGLWRSNRAWLRHLFCKRLRRAIAHRGLIMKRCGCALRTHSKRRTMNWVK